MAKLVTRKVTTTVTEEVELVPTTPGKAKGHRLMKVRGYGSYRGNYFTVEFKSGIEIDVRL